MQLISNTTDEGEMTNLTSFPLNFVESRGHTITFLEQMKMQFILKKN